jgi:hypothetical protein
MTQPVSTQVMSSSISIEASSHATPGYRLQRPVASSSPTPVLMSSESKLNQLFLWAFR